MAFNFNFNDEQKQDESAELEGLKQDKPTEAPTNNEELTNNTKEKAEDNKQINSKATEKEEPKKAGNVLVSYVGNGTWVDADRERWSKNAKPDVGILTNRTYTKEEYEIRGDLKFMVNYGEMTAVEV